MSQRRHKASPKARLRSPRQTMEDLRQALSRERALRKQALDRQTATAEILKVISESPSYVQPVFDAIVHSAVRLLRGYSGALSRVNGDEIVLAANTSTDEAGNAATKAVFPQPLKSEFPHAQAIRSGMPFNVADARTDGRLLEDARAYAHVRGYRSWIVVPMLGKNEAIGAIGVTRREAGGFTDDEIALLQTFAAQAMIAIENVRLFNETKEALEQQRATGEILASISSSVADTQPVFDAIVQSAQRLMCGKLAVLLLRRGTDFYEAAHSIPGVQSLPAQVRMVPLDREKNYPSQVILDRRVVHVPDWEADDVLENEKFVGNAYGIGSGVHVPLVRKGEGIGSLAVTRATKGAFSEKEIALLQSFADQAVIAIENARLFNETKEALERQTATADILKVISASPTDVQPVFNAVAERAAQLCNAMHAVVLIAEQDVLRVVARIGGELPFGELPIRRTLLLGRAFLERRTVHVEDVLPLLDYEYPDTRENQRKIGYRSFLCVPMIREGSAIGVIGIWRPEVKPFSKAQIELLETFADQAVIAIENVRLFNETKEALEQQTAISEVLRVISASPANVQPVLDAVAQRAARISGVKHSSVFLANGDVLRRVATAGPVVELNELPIRRTVVNGRAFLERRPVHVPDLVPLLESEYPDARESQRRMGSRTLLSVPLLRKGHAIGTIIVWRREVHPFSQGEIGLLETFADQAVIAIENARLFNETKDALEQQKASADVLGAISASIADTKPVFDKILDSCERLFEGTEVGIMLVGEDGLGRLGAYHGRQAKEDLMPVPITMDSGTGRAILTRQVLHYPDVLNDPAVPSYLRLNAESSGSDQRCLHRCSGRIEV